MDTTAEGLYPIQLRWLSVRRLSISLHRRPDRNYVMPEGEFGLTNGHTEYDHTEKTIEVAVKAEIGTAEAGSALPFHLVAELLAQFKVDESKFPVEKIDVWASVNAPLILYPYLREHVYSLTQRSGFSSIMLPLLHLPTVRFAKGPAEPVLESH